MVAWMLLGIPTGYFTGLPASALWIDFVTSLLVLIFTPVVMLKARWTALGAMIVGVINIIKDILGVVMMPPSLAFGPAVAIVLMLLFTYFSLRAYQEK